MTYPFQTLFSEYKNDVDRYLTRFFHTKKKEYSHFTLDEEIFEKLLDFTKRGKMFRGSILRYIAERLSQNISKENLVIAASALELFEAAILIQDDVMDQDDFRRGSQSLYKFFSQHTPNILDERRNKFGESIATSIGSMGYFLSFEILSQLTVSPHVYKKIIQLFSKEMTLLNFAQVQDIYLSDKDGKISEKEIVQMYQGKTARYTWILPMQIALILSHSEKYNDIFEQIGGSAGIIYQLIDDKIGLFGDQQDIGKPVGSDIREGKKTLYWLYTQSSLLKNDKEEFDNLYGKKDISFSDIQKVKELIKKSNAEEKIETHISEYLTSIKNILSALEIDRKTKDNILELVFYISLRKK